MTRQSIALIIILASVTISGCASLANDQALTSTPPRTGQTDARTGGVVSDRAFWQGFNSPQLLALLERADSANPDFRIMAHRLTMARDNVLLAQARQKPWLGFALGPTDTTATQLQHPDTRQPAAFSLGFSARYELDLWGRLSSLTKSAKATYTADAYDIESARIAVITQVAEAYFDVAQTVEQTQLLRRRRTLAERRIKLETARLNAGETTEPRLDQARGTLELLQNQLAETKRRQRRSEYRLALLVGMPPEKFSIQTGPLRQQVSLPPVPAGLPSTLVQRRPDLLAAKSRLQAARYQVAAAHAEQLPRFSLTAQLGVATDVLHNITSGLVGLFGVGPDITLPLYDGGSGKARVDLSQQAADIALLSYHKTVLAALSDVENALMLRQSALGRQALSASSGARQQHQLNRLNARIEAGLSSRLDAIALRDQQLDNQYRAIEDYRAQLDSLLVLFQALGGGWPQAGVLPEELHL